MDSKKIQIGQSIQTSNLIDSLKGVYTSPERLKNRKSNSFGTVLAPIEQYEGFIWLIQHEDETLALYRADELHEAKSMLATY